MGYLRPKPRFPVDPQSDGAYTRYNDRPKRRETDGQTRQRGLLVGGPRLPVSDEEVIIGSHGDVSRRTQSFRVRVASRRFKLPAQHQRRLLAICRVELEYLQSHIHTSL